MEAEIVILESDAPLARSIGAQLQREGIHCRLLGRASTAIHEIRARPPSLLILGQADQDIHWMSTVAQVRELPLRTRIPILMLAYGSSEAELLAAFRCGVDDVITKPPSMRLLVARALALLRRSRRPPGGAAVLSTGSVTLDLERYELLVEGRPVPVSPKEFRVMATLLKAGGRVLSRDELLREALGARTAVTQRCADAYIIRLRKKLKAAGTLLKTVRGFGYAFRVEGR